MSEQQTIQGQCLCGRVRVQAQRQAPSVGVCHCAACRTWGGGPFFALEDAQEVRFEGEEHITAYDSSEWAQRAFCKHCGTHLYFRVKQTGHYVLPVGLLQGGADWRLDAQIFVDAKPDFYSLDESPAMLTGAQFFAQHAPG